MPKPIIDTEPRRRGSTVVDRDGRLWERANTLWHHRPDKGEVGQGRIPWARLRDFGPLLEGTRYRQHQSDELLASLAYLSDDALEWGGTSRAAVDAAIAGEQEWNAP